ncbi:uncharacterized protein [Nicotiana tomentosiformis]|uniref:uncharacterized protein n=1 Tax=Nicotiana tomentosiformis TaxID=4098 RepID=UPI00388CA375
MIFGGDKVNGVMFSAAKKMKISVTHGKRIREAMENNINFITDDADGLLLPHNDALVVSLNVLDFKTKRDHLNHLQETFDILMKYNIKLNPKKCTFGVGSAVVTTFPLRNILHKPELSGRLAKLAVEVSEFDIEYKPRTVIKSQVLANFVANFYLGLMPLAAKVEMLVSGTVSGIWTLFTDRASNVKGSGLEIVLNTPLGETPRQAIRSVPLTNNEAKYEALVSGLELARGLVSKVIEIKCDSQPVVNQVYGIFDTKEECMHQYFNKVQIFLSRFREWSIIHIIREVNVEAQELANLGLSTKMKGSNFGAVVQLLHSVLDVNNYCEVNSTNLIWDWRNEFIEYIRHGKLPEDPKASRTLRTKAARYCLVDSQLYRRSFQGPLARCLGTLEADYVMREVHEGVCGNHSDAVVGSQIDKG